MNVKKIEKPWGYEEIWAVTENYVGKMLIILPGHRLSLQYHEKKEETLYVLSGFLRIWESKDNESYRDLGPGGVYHVKPGQIHRFGCASSEKTKLVEVSTNYLEDVIRIEDDYKR